MSLPLAVLRFTLTWFLCSFVPSWPVFFALPDPLHTAARKHAAFVRARGRHYSNEAEAMKVRSDTIRPLRPDRGPAQRTASHN